MKTQRQAWGHVTLEWSTVVDTNAGAAQWTSTGANVPGPVCITQTFSVGSEFVLVNTNDWPYSWTTCFLEYDGRLRWEYEIYETDETATSLNHQWGTSGDSFSRDSIFEDPSDPNKAYFVPFLDGTTKASGWTAAGNVPLILHVDVSGTAPTFDDQALGDYDSSGGNGPACVMPNGDIVTADGNVIFIHDASATPAYSTGTRVAYNNMDGIWHLTNKGDDIVVTGYSNDGTYDMATVTILDSDYSTINATRRWNINTDTYCYGNWTIVSGDNFYVLTTEDDFAPDVIEPPTISGGTNYPGVTKLDSSLNVTWCYHSNYAFDGVTDFFTYDESGRFMPSIAINPYEDQVYLMVPNAKDVNVWSVPESLGGAFLLKINGSTGALLWEKKLQGAGSGEIHSPRISYNDRALFFCGYYEDGDGIIDKVCAAKLFPWTVDGASENGPYHVWDFADTQQWTDDWTREDNLGPFQEETPATFTVTTSTCDGSNEDEASARQMWSETYENIHF